MRLLLETALALFAGLMMTRVFKYLKLNFPDVTAFLIAGVLVGPYMLGGLGIHGIGFNSMEDLESVSSLSNVALGFIAFDIGNACAYGPEKTIHIKSCRSGHEQYMSILAASFETP